MHFIQLIGSLIVIMPCVDCISKTSECSNCLSGFLPTPKPVSVPGTPSTLSQSSSSTSFNKRSLTVMESPSHAPKLKPMLFTPGSKKLKSSPVPLPVPKPLYVITDKRGWSDDLKNRFEMWDSSTKTRFSSCFERGLQAHAAKKDFYKVDTARKAGSLHLKKLDMSLATCLDRVDRITKDLVKAHTSLKDVLNAIESSKETTFPDEKDVNAAKAVFLQKSCHSRLVLKGRDASVPVDVNRLLTLSPAAYTSVADNTVQLLRRADSKFEKEFMVCMSLEASYQTSANEPWGDEVNFDVHNL